MKYDSFEERGEGAKATGYKSTVILKNETLIFNDHNVFDFGRVINFCYIV